MKPIKGERDSWSESDIIDGKYVEIHVKKEVVEADEITSPIGEATITHTGAYGRIKFIFEGRTFVSRSSPEFFRRLEKDVPQRVSYLAISEGDAKVAIPRRVIDVSNIDFNRLDILELHSKFFIPAVTKDSSLYWVPIINL